MNRHSYNLQKYAGVRSRHTCPSCGGKRCFTLYVDENGAPLAGNVGRCDHESSCGYHYTPSEYFRDHPEKCRNDEWKTVMPHYGRMEQQPCVKKNAPPDTIPREYVVRSVRPDMDSSLTGFLRKAIDHESLDRVIREYCLGVTKDRSAIFFQIDAAGKCRTGKIMKYNPDTGHRIKDESVPSRITWVHSVLKSRGLLPPSWTLTQCLFGEHLLQKYPVKKVALVESEKTAVICAALMPQYVWLATGGKTQLGDKLQVLKGRDVIAFPDVDGYDEWKAKLALVPGLPVKVSDYLERTASAEDRDAHMDIADLLLRKVEDDFPGIASSTRDKSTMPGKLDVLKFFSEDTRTEVEALIEELGLIPVSILRE